MKKHLILLTIILNTFFITTSINAQMGFKVGLDVLFINVFKNNDLMELQRLLEEHHDKINQIKSENRENLLLLAIKDNASPEVIRMLLKTGVKPNTHDKYGMTPLLKAIKKNNIKAAETLLKNGADPNFFIFQKHLPWEKKCNIDTARFPLTYSAVLGKVRFVQLLIRWNADVNIRSETCVGDTPLYSAVDYMSYYAPKKRKQYLEVIKFLLKAKANMYLIGREGVPLKILRDKYYQLKQVYPLFLKYGYDKKKGWVPSEWDLKRMKTVGKERNNKMHLQPETQKRKKYDQWDLGLKIGLGSNFQSQEPSFTLGVFHYTFFNVSPFGMKTDLAYQNFYMDDDNYKMLNFNPSFIWNFADRFYLGAGFYAGLPLNDKATHDIGLSASLGYMNNYFGMDITFQQGLVKDFINQQNKSLLLSIQLDNHFLIPVSLVGLTGYGFYKQPVVTGVVVGGLIFLTYSFLSRLRFG